MQIGSLITIYMKSGHTYSGAIREYSEKQIVIANPSGKYYVITNTSEVEGYSYEVSNEKIVTERNPKDIKPQHVLGDVQSLTELKKMKASEEIKEIRNKLKSKECSTKEVTYASTLSALPAFKKYPG